MNSSAVIKMPKRFDYSSSTEFNSAISKALETPGAITLDCRELDYIDSAGIGLLVMSEKKAQSLHSKLVMINLKTAPREVLGLANLQKFIDIQ